MRERREECRTFKPCIECQVRHSFINANHGPVSLFLTASCRPEKLASGMNIVGNVLIDPSARIGEGCLIGPDVSIGPNCVIEDGVRLKGCTIMKGVQVQKHAIIIGSIIG